MSRRPSRSGSRTRGWNHSPGFRDRQCDHNIALQQTLATAEGGNWEQGPPLRATVRSFHRVGWQVLPKPRATHPVTQQSPARRSQPQNDSSATAEGICGGTVYPDFLFPCGCPYQLLKPRSLKQQALTLPCLWRLEVLSRWHWAKVKDHVRPPKNYIKVLPVSGGCKGSLLVEFLAPPGSFKSRSDGKDIHGDDLTGD